MAAPAGCQSATLPPALKCNARSCGPRASKAARVMLPGCGGAAAAGLAALA
ncbi:hypothetical protein Tco_0577303, partial [Tanacetum coccineum]